MRVLADLSGMGHQVILVSSGAIAIGTARLSLPERPKELRMKQAAAAVGQCRMTVGLACGMGYLALGAFASVIVCAVTPIAKGLSPAASEADRDLKITIPENLDYSGLFDDLMDQYTNASALMNVKTTNLGSLYCLHYHIQLKDTASEKEFIDHLRCRNGNLDITCGRISTAKDIL